MQRRARLIAITTTAIGLSVLLAAGALVARKWFRETELIEALRSPTEAVRRDAAARLATIGSPRAARALADVLEKECRGNAWFELLYKHDDVPAPRENYIAIPGHGITYYEVHYAALALREMGAPAVPELARLLGHEDWFVQVQAAMMLARLGGRARQAVDALIAVLGEHGSSVVTGGTLHPWTFECAAAALARIGCEARRAVQVLRNLPAGSEAHAQKLAAIANKILLDCGEVLEMSPSEKEQLVQLNETLETWF